MFALNFPVEGLQATAWSALLFAGTALVLAVVVAVVLSVLDELLLRRLFHLWAMRAWLDQVVGDKNVRSRAEELQSAFSPPNTPTETKNEPTFHEDENRKTFWDLAKPASGMPSRHLLGLLSASVQAEVSNRRPSSFVCWLAAVGSMPILTSPFAELQPRLRPLAPKQDDSKGHLAKTSSIPSAEDEQDNTAARSALQTYAERALDGLQVRVLRTRTIAWHFAAATLVGALVTLLASQASSSSSSSSRVQPATRTALALATPASGPTSATSAPSALSTVGEVASTSSEGVARPASSASAATVARPSLAPWSTRLNALLLYVALSAVATAFVAVLAGPLERLAATRNS